MVSIIKKIALGNTIHLLLGYARKLTKPYPFVRYDFYFGSKLTFTLEKGLDAETLPYTDK